VMIEFGDIIEFIPSVLKAIKARVSSRKSAMKNKKKAVVKDLIG